MSVERAVSIRVVRTAIAGTVLLGVGAAVLSFTALTDLAVRAGVPTGLGFVWPVIVDGLIVVSTVAVFATSTPAQAGARRYAWLLLGVGAVVSIVANATHALVAAPAATSRVLAVSVASVPPVFLLLLTHLTAVLAGRSTSPAAATTTTPEAGPTREPDPERETTPRLPAERAVAAPEVASKPAMTPEPATASAAAVASASVASSAASAERAASPKSRATASEAKTSTPASDVELRAWVARMVRSGVEPTGRAAYEAGLAGSLRTASRRVSALREAEPDLFQERVLHLPAARGA